MPVDDAAPSRPRNLPMSQPLVPSGFNNPPESPTGRILHDRGGAPTNGDRAAKSANRNPGALAIAGERDPSVSGSEDYEDSEDKRQFLASRSIPVAYVGPGIWSGPERPTGSPRSGLGLPDAGFLDPTAAPPRVPPERADGIGEIERSFGEPREAAVRLVEPSTGLRRLGEASTLPRVNYTQLFRSIFGKWAPEILTTLHEIPSLGFEALRRDIRGISPRVLSRKLRSLEGHSLVLREIVDARPPRVLYALTNSGSRVAQMVHSVFQYLCQPEGP
jgi:DNA-binding HxlR family transcriptional regulator